MPLGEAFLQALRTIASAKLRSVFTLLGIIVSVAFLVIVVAVIQGMNSYVRDSLTGAIIGKNAFQIRRTPISIGFMSDAEIREIAKRPPISERDADALRRALPDARAVALQSGRRFTVIVEHDDQELGGVLVHGITPGYQVVQDYQVAAGLPLTQASLRGRRPELVVGWDVATKLFRSAAAAVGQPVRIAGQRFMIKGVMASKGKTLGQSLDGFVLMPLPMYESIWGRHRGLVVSVKVASADQVQPTMARAEEAMRVAHQLRPTQKDDFAIDKADALVAFWTSLTSLLFAIIPAVVCIGVVVGGIVIMNIMLASVSERTREIGLRKAMGATHADIRRQFLVETVVLASIGGLIGVAIGALLAGLVNLATPLPARITAWSVAVALALGAISGVVFGVYPATRAARLDPITALRQE